jgi:hypothetical protein
MRWLALDRLDAQTVEELFCQAVIAHPKVHGSDGHVMLGMMEFAELVTVELETRLNSRERKAAASNLVRGGRWGEGGRPGANST